jgi:GntR family transcriptional regulator, transcriptional repressor for pyruvate dehydrogenase complex
MSASLFYNINHGSTSDEVIRQIEWLILEGVLRPGDRLPSERDLSAEMDVSRPVLRDALKSLETRGLVVTRHGGGTVIADVISDVFAQPVADLIASHRKALADYLEYRREIEALAAGHAAERATEADRLMLKRILAQMHAAHTAGNFTDEARADVEFHNAVSECAHNIILLHTLRSCYKLHMNGVFYNRTLLYCTPGVRAALLTQHEAIADAILSHDPERARAASCDHIRFVETQLALAEQAGEWSRVAQLRLAQSEKRSRIYKSPEHEGIRVSNDS